MLIKEQDTGLYVTSDDKQYKNYQSAYKHEKSIGNSPLVKKPDIQKSLSIISESLHPIANYNNKHLSKANSNPEASKLTLGLLALAITGFLIYIFFIKGRFSNNPDDTYENDRATVDNITWVRD